MTLAANEPVVLTQNPLLNGASESAEWYAPGPAQVVVFPAGYAQTDDSLQELVISETVMKTNPLELKTSISRVASNTSYVPGIGKFEKSMSINELVRNAVLLYDNWLRPTERMVSLPLLLKVFPLSKYVSCMTAGYARSDTYAPS